LRHLLDKGQPLLQRPPRRRLLARRMGRTRQGQPDLGRAHVQRLHGAQPVGRTFCRAQCTVRLAQRETDLRQAHVQRQRGAGVVGGCRFVQRLFHQRQALLRRQGHRFHQPGPAQRTAVAAGQQRDLGRGQQLQGLCRLLQLKHESCAHQQGHGLVHGAVGRGLRAVQRFTRQVDAAQLHPQGRKLALQVFLAVVLLPQATRAFQVRHGFAPAAQAARAGAQADAQHGLDQAFAARHGTQCGQPVFVRQLHLAAFFQRNGQVVEHTRPRGRVGLALGRLLHQRDGFQVSVLLLQHQAQVVEHTGQVGVVAA